METVCKPVGGAVVDIQNIAITDAGRWTAQGYYQCGDGHAANTGYCLTTPHETSCEASPYGNDPTPFQQQTPTPAPAVSTMTATPPPAVTNRLPQVGAGNAEILIALGIAVIVGSVTYWKNRLA